MSEKDDAKSAMRRWFSDTKAAALTGLIEDIESSFDSHLFMLQYNVIGLIKCLLFPLVLELEKDGIVCGIDELVGILFRTTKENGPEGETYPSWALFDRLPYTKADVAATDRAKEIMAGLVKVLKAHGIEPNYDV